MVPNAPIDSNQARRIATELHDGPLATLNALGFQLAALSRRVGTESTELDDIREMKKQAQAAQKNLKRIMREIDPQWDLMDEDLPLKAQE